MWVFSDPWGLPPKQYSYGGESIEQVFGMIQSRFMDIHLLCLGRTMQHEGMTPRGRGAGRIQSHSHTVNMKIWKV